MKRTLTLIAIFCAVVPALANASFTGNWSGNGGATFGPGNNMNCERVSFQFEQGFQFFEIRRGDAVCGFNRFNFPTGMLTIENGVLKDRGLAVGMIGPDYFHLSYSYRPGTLNILDVRLLGKGAISVVHTTADTQRGTTEIRGNLGNEFPF